MDDNQTLVKLHYRRVSAQSLDKAPISEKIFFVKAMQVLTEIALAQKSVIFSNKGAQLAKANSVERKAQNCQTTYFMRSLAGILEEAFQLVQKGFFSQNLREKYHDMFGDGTKEALQKISRYFSGSKSLIHSVRNELAYHYDLEKTEAELGNFSGGHEFDVYFSETHGNCYYGLGEHVMVSSLVKLTGKDDFDEGFKTVIDELSEISGYFQDFLGSYVFCFFSNYIDDGSPPEIVNVMNPPCITDVIIPFFSLSPKVSQTD